ncbi:neuronal acetylcholine receptor subunit alpha-10-like isoform X3 [Porites lutea]|uniref:neuronal acetylcholine receptor subunit alpha-10-like isoform X3 n=1 Tax=Porites lutea TaxID=51062 RepID=UPI003CC5BEEA
MHLTFIFVNTLIFLIYPAKGLSDVAFNASVISEPITNTTDSDDAGLVQDDDDELRLVRDLFEHYDINVRPTVEKELPIVVKFGIAYTQIVDLIEKDQVLVSNIWVRMSWHNHLLRWNSSEYGGIKTINLNPLKVWRPDIVLHNNAEETLPSGNLYNFKNRIILTSDGGCTWYAPTILRSGCNIDITYFPFDDQLCELKFGSWTYNGFEVNIVQMSDKADLKFYMESSEFQLISAKAQRNVVTYSCCPEPYPDVTFNLHLRRKPGFFLYNIIIPCLVIAALAVLTFVLPPEIGERVTLVIESFLALSFVVLMVSDSVPVTSDSSPLLTKFLLISMVEIGCALISNCISLNLYRKYPMPQWVRVVFLHYLARCLCIKTGHPRDNINTKKRKGGLTDPLVEARKLSGAKLLGSPTGSAVKNCVIPHRANQDTTTLLTEGLSELAQFEINKDEHQANRHFWIFVSRVVDRLLLLLFSIAFVFSSCVIFAQVPDHYNLLI